MFKNKFVLLTTILFFSVLASDVISFTLGLWIYKEFDSTTLYTWIGAATLLPSLLVAPFFGVWIDSQNKKKLIIISLIGEMVCVTLLALVFLLGYIKIWQIVIIIAAISSLFSGLSLQILQVSSTLLVSKKNLSRAQALIQAVYAIVFIGSPVFSAMLFDIIDLKTIFCIAVIFYIITAIFISLVHFPKKFTKCNEARSICVSETLKEVKSAWSYIKNRAGFTKLLVLSFLMDFQMGVCGALFIPYVLSFSNVITAGNVFSIVESGMLIGNVIMIIWAGPKKKITGVLGFGLFASAGIIVFSVVMPTVMSVAILGFIANMLISLSVTCNIVLWQENIPGQMQGKVLGLRRLVAMSGIPVAYLIAGPVVDNIFAPLFKLNGLLHNSIITQIISTKNAQPIALMFLISGILAFIAVGIGLISSSLYEIENKIKSSKKMVGCLR